MSAKILYKYFNKNSILLLQRRYISTTSRINAKWYPDTEFMRTFDGPVMYPDHITSKLKPPLWSNNIRPKEMKIHNMTINFGPAHPAAHGVMRLILLLDGEVIRKTDVHVGLLHRSTEKLCEYRNYIQNLPYIDRLDYISMMANEACYCHAIEKLCGIEVPPRAKYIRVIYAEFSRILSHLMSFGGFMIDTGAITPYFHMFEEREKLMEFYERACGARLHSAYVRPGGVDRDIPIGLLDDIHDFCEKFPQRLDEVEDLMTDNRIALSRWKDIGVVNAQSAVYSSFSGVMLRCAGVKWDLRKEQPYDCYDELEFEVPIGVNGDCYDRYLCRMEEMRQSCHIIHQCINKIPPGPIKTDDNKFCPPLRHEMKTSMEACIHHFKLFSQGFQVPPGTVYSAIEAPKGEFGVLIVSDGSSVPYRMHFRSPGFPHLLGSEQFVKGTFLADAVVILGSVDFVFGDVDR